MKAKKKKEGKSKSKRKKRLMIFGIAAGIFIILAIIAVEFTSHSGFCASCHYMKSYFESWETSSHAEVECNVCHYPPGGGIKSKLETKIEGLVMVGRYWTKLYMKSKPWAEIKDASCLREGCHEKRLLEGQVRFKSVVFDHGVHLEDLKRGKKLQCTSCHSQIVQGEHITVTETSCFICHFKESESYPEIAKCTHCHTKEILVGSEVKYNHSLVFQNGFTCVKCHSNTIIGDGEVPRENCYKCHMERERLAKYKDTDLMHDEHIAKSKIECNQCHVDIQHKIIKDVDTLTDCQSCHTNFHEAQKILYLGEGGKGVDHPMPNVMLEKGLSCKGCHIFHEESKEKNLLSETFTSDAKACESCHGKGYSRVLKEWEVSTYKKLSQIKSIYKRVFNNVRASTHSQKTKALELMKEANYNIDIVNKGKSVHNVSFSQELLKASYTKMLSALSVIESKYKPQVFVAVPENIPTECSTCHSGIEDIKKSIYGVEFAHFDHLVKQKLDCSLCHSNARKHGELVASKKSCSVCHHKSRKKSCGECHSLQKTFYEGGQLKSTSIEKDIMFEAETACEDCHLHAKSRSVIRPGKEACIECHDSEYGDTFSEWQNTVRKSIANISNIIKAKRKNSLLQSDKDVLNSVENMLQNIIKDGSTGVHNFMAIDEILSTLLKQAMQVGENQK